VPPLPRALLPPLHLLFLIIFTPPVGPAIAPPPTLPSLGPLPPALGPFSPLSSRALDHSCRLSSFLVPHVCTSCSLCPLVLRYCPRSLAFPPVHILPLRQSEFSLNCDDWPLHFPSVIPDDGILRLTASIPTTLGNCTISWLPLAHQTSASPD